MKKITLLGLLAVVAVTLQASAANVLLNGDWATGTEANWTRWRAPWGATESWAVTLNGPTAPEGTLSGGGGNGSFGWYQVVAVPAGTTATVSADWSGNIGSSGDWAEVMLFSSAYANEDWGARADTGAAADIAFEKDSWGMNPPTDWGWQAASLSPHPSGNGGTIYSAGYVCVALKVGGFPMGWASFDNITVEVIPEPSAALLLLAGLPLLLRRRA
jgi:hypothetical protein